MSLTWNTLTGTTNTPGALARWLNKSTLSSGAGGDADLILQEATAWIFARLRHWQMLTAPISATMVVGADQIAVPADVLEFDFIMIAGVASGTFYQQELLQKPINEVYRAWAYDGTGARIQQTPLIYSFNQSFIQMDQQPDLAYPYVYTYYQLPAALSANNATNFLTTFYPRLLRSVCMMMGAEWTKEANQGQYDRTYWEQQAADELNAAQTQSDRARRAIRGGVTVDEHAVGAFW
jgi:hypothetical protein